MSRTNKIIIAIVVIIILLGIASITGMLIVGGLMLADNMKKQAESIYGAPLPSTVTSGMAMNIAKTKRAVLLDKKTNLVITLVQLPDKDQISQAEKPFSESDLASYARQSTMEAEDLETFQHGTSQSLKVYQQTVHILKAKNRKGQLTALAVLHLDQGTTLFYVCDASFSSDIASQFRSFLEQMPQIQHDSHLKKYSRQNQNTSQQIAQDYINQISPRVRKAWHPPNNLQNYQVVVRFTLTTQGQAEHLSVQKSSGTDLFDQRALAAIRDAQPFPKTPLTQHGPLEVEYTFDYKVTDNKS